MADRRSNRRRYTAEEKDAALYSVREIGVAKTSRRLGIPAHTLYDWRAATKACAYSPYVGRDRKIEAEERARLLAQLIHEQELEMRYINRSSYRNDPRGKNPNRLPVSLDILLTKYGVGVTQRHLIEWLDPTFDEVAESLAA